MYLCLGTASEHRKLQSGADAIGRLSEKKFSGRMGRKIDWLYFRAEKNGKIPLTSGWMATWAVAP